jgi:hypothetical protein
MTPNETKVAEAAINAGKESRYEQIYESASAVTGVPVDQVKEILERLATEGVLWKKGGPAQNLAEGGVAGALTAKGWYEKGDCWPKD